MVAGRSEIAASSCSRRADQQVQARRAGGLRKSATQGRRARTGASARTLAFSRRARLAPLQLFHRPRAAIVQQGAGGERRPAISASRPARS